jgi:RNA-directed DNA polymerase
MISDYCIQRKIRYTPADDLSFSGDFDEKELFVIVKESLKNEI